MNWWWFLFIPLACSWVFPMYGIHRANNLPPLFFVAMAAMWTILGVFIRPLYNQGTDLMRKLGGHRLADFREKLMPRIIPPVRAALFIMAGISFVFAVL